MLVEVCRENVSLLEHVARVTFYEAGNMRTFYIPFRT